MIKKIIYKTVNIIYRVFNKIILVQGKVFLSSMKLCLFCHHKLIISLFS